MIILNKDTKQAQRFLYQYRIATNYQLSQCYKDFSNAKARAFIYCENIADTYKGFGRFIIGYNCNYFTYAFLSNNHNFVSDRNIVDLHIITYANHYVIKNLLIDEL